MDVPASIKIKDEEIVLPLLSTTDLLPTYAKLKERRLQALKDSLKDVPEIEPLEKLEMLRRERNQFYNIFLIVDYAATPEGMTEIWRMSLKKDNKTEDEITRILALPVSAQVREEKAVQIVNPTENGEAPPKDTGAGAGGNPKLPAAPKVFGNPEDVLAAAMEESSNPPSQPTPNGA